MEMISIKFQLLTHTENSLNQKMNNIDVNSCVCKLEDKKAQRKKVDEQRNSQKA